MRRWLLGVSGVALVAMPCWGLAQDLEAHVPRMVEVEHDAVSARGEAEHSARLDADRDAHRREVALARARREAPFDLTWGIER